MSVYAVGVDNIKPTEISKCSYNVGTYATQNLG